MFPYGGRREYISTFLGPEKTFKNGGPQGAWFQGQMGGAGGGGILRNFFFFMAVFANPPPAQKQKYILLPRKGPFLKTKKVQGGGTARKSQE